MKSGYYWVLVSRLDTRVQIWWYEHETDRWFTIANRGMCTPPAMVLMGPLVQPEQLAANVRQEAPSTAELEKRLEKLEKVVESLRANAGPRARDWMGR